MPKNAKDKIIDPEKIKQKRRKEIKKKRQQIAKALKKLNDFDKKTPKFLEKHLNTVWYWGNKREAKRALPKYVRRKYIFIDGNQSLKNIRIIGKFENFWAKNREFIDRYLCRSLHLFGPQEEENEEDTALWFNLEDVKNSTDLRECWKFIKEWKVYFKTYRKLMWGEKTRRKTISEKMWSEIRQYYYTQLMPKEKLDKFCGVSYESAKAKRYEIIAEKFNKAYESLLPGKHPPVPQEDAFWRKFYSIKDEYSKKLTAIKIK